MARELAVIHPDAHCELDFTNAFELLVATVLSAPTTDKMVNKVTPTLFARYPDAVALAGADRDELETILKPTGFFRAKANSVLGLSQALVERFDGAVPGRMKDLVTLPGVGRKTANVVLGHALGVPGLPVDRHVLRVANRIGIAESDDPIVVEQQLCAAMPPERWTRTSDVLILHGRRICRPKPLCDECAVRDDCDYYRTVIAQERGRAPAQTSKAGRIGKTPRVAKSARPSKIAKIVKTTKPTRKAGAARRVRTPRR